MKSQNAQLKPEKVEKEGKKQENKHNEYLTVISKVSITTKM